MDTRSQLNKSFFQPPQEVLQIFQILQKMAIVLLLKLTAQSELGMGDREHRKNIFNLCYC